MENREILRKQVLEKRKHLSANEFKNYSKQIFYQLVNNELFIQADSIFIYLSFMNEVETREIINYAMGKQKRIGVPSIKENEIFPILFGGWESLKKGYAGIEEPREKKRFELSEKTIIFVPGLVFDYHGNRLGFGKGFYDRFLKNKKNLKVGLAYSFQLVERIDSHPDDVPMDYIITEKEFIDLRNNFL